MMTRYPRLTIVYTQYFTVKVTATTVGTIQSSTSRCCESTETKLTVDLIVTLATTKIS